MKDRLSSSPVYTAGNLSVSFSRGCFKEISCRQESLFLEVNVSLLASSAVFTDQFSNWLPIRIHMHNKRLQTDEEMSEVLKRLSSVAT